jgi:hypothetical protein
LIGEKQKAGRAEQQCLVKIYEGQQNIKIIRTNQQSNLLASCQPIFSLWPHYPSCIARKNGPESGTDNPHTRDKEGLLIFIKHGVQYIWNVGMGLGW